MSSTAVSATPIRWPWVLVAGFFVIAFVGFGFVLAHDEDVLEQFGFVLAFGMFGVVGAMIVSRDRRNVIGLLLLWGSAITALSFLSGELTTAFALRGRTGIVATIVAVVGNVGWLFGIVPVLFLLLLLFPDGRFPSPRWRYVWWFILANGVLVLSSMLVGTPELTGSREDVVVDNPFYVPAVADAIGWYAEAGWTFVLLFGLSVSAIVVRFRRSRGVERQQITWFVTAAVFAFGSLVVSELIVTFAPEIEGIDSVVSALAFLALPASIGVAVLKYHLYDLDVVVRKTLVYAMLAVFATLVYLAVVVGAGAWLGRDNSLLTMVAAVIVAVSFQPVRERLTRLANRLVYGRRATPYEVLAEFSERVGEAYADDDVLPRMARVLGEGVGAERADVWLKVDDGLRDVAVWPPAGARMAPVALPNGAVPAIEGADRVYAVEHRGALLGALAITKPANDPVSPADDKLVADLAAQAGLVLRNVRLAEELRARLDDLRAAQKRIVAAQDEERRRLERNIHDGAQQQLVALAVKARLARSLAERDPPKAGEMLEQIEAETQAALEDLRDLARGIYPPLLADEGLAAALRAQARRAPFHVEVRADSLGRYPAEIEAAVYFSCLEALQNAAKYADAGEVTVSLSDRDGTLTFEITDDGRGFDPAAARTGTGLQGIEDRLVAIDGTLAIRSEPGRGATVSGRVPTGSSEDVARPATPSSVTRAEAAG